MTEEANAGGRKATGNQEHHDRLALRQPLLDNWPDTGLVPGPERVLTRSGEPVRRKMTEAPEPKDKLDAYGKRRRRTDQRTANLRLSGPGRTF